MSTTTPESTIVSFLSSLCKVSEVGQTGREAYKAIIKKSEATHGYLLGDDDSQRKSVDDYITGFEKDFENAEKQVQALHKLNKSLVGVYLVLNHVSLADIVAFVHLHPIVAKWAEKDKITFYNITRWFNHIQHLKGFTNTISSLPFISLPVDAPEETAAPAKQAAKQPAGDADNKGKGKAKSDGGDKPSAPSTSTSSTSTGGGEGKGKGKGKAEGSDTAKPAAPSGNKGGKAAAKPAAVDRPEDVSRLDIRVGKIVACKKHEGADSLYVEEIEVGEAAPRIVVSGLVKFVPLDQMQNRMVLVLCNLKPANLKGIKSHAMVLAASNADHTQVELIDPPASSKIGERVTFEGYEGEADKVLKPEIFATVAS